MKRDQPPASPGATAKLRGEAGAIVLFGTIAALYFAREILIPLAFALTLTFLLTPAVGLLQRLHIGRVVSVLATVLASVGVIGGISWVIATQLVDVANQFPLYSQNIHARIEGFHLPATGQLGRAAKSVEDLVQELSGPSTPSPPLTLPGRKQNRLNAPPAAASPIPVEVVQPSAGGWTELRDLGHARSRASGTGGHGRHLYDLHAAEARGPEKPPSAAGRTRPLEPYDPGA